MAAQDHPEIPTKRRKGSDHQHRQGGIESLPLEIVSDIFSRLPITTLAKLKFVCRSWRSLTQEPSLLQVRNHPPGPPCLIFHSDFPLRSELRFVDLGEERRKVRKLNMPFLAAMPEFDVVGSCNGLICLSDSLYNDDIYIYNPFTRNYVELPRAVKYHHQESVFGFGFCPKTNRYKVMKMVYYRNERNNVRRRRIRRPLTQSELQILTVGDSTWRSLGRVPYYFDRCPSYDMLVNGRLHWITRLRGTPATRSLVSFSLEKEEFQEIPKPDSGWLNLCNYSPVSLKGCLGAVVYGNHGKLDIWVMKEYNVKESWVKEFSVGAYMPKGLKQQNLERTVRPLRHREPGKMVRVLCVLDSGEVLLEYKHRVLVTYDPTKAEFKELVFQGMPTWFRTVVHVGSLRWLDDATPS